MKKGIEVKVVKVLSESEIMIDRKIRGCNIIKISNLKELLGDLKEE